MEGFREGSGQPKKKKDPEITKSYLLTKSSSLNLLLEKYPNQKKSTIKQTKKV